MIMDVVVVHQDHLMGVRVIQDAVMIHIVMVVEVVVVN
jgi:hypothetical protein